MLRTEVILEKDGGALKEMLIPLPFKLGLGCRLENSQQYMSWIHMKDVIGAINFPLAIFAML